jgi:predicted nuclease with TOPRIM domain
VLALADQQGFLYSHQLPPINNGNAKPRVEPTHALWQQLLAGRTETLAPTLAKDFEPFNPALTAEQSFAVARALASPDVCLFEVPHSVDVLPVLVEIVEQETQRRHRVAILANQATRLDGIVQRLQDRSQLFVLRYPTSLGADWAHGGTDAQRQAFRERILTRARTAHRDFEEHCQRRNREASLWDTMRDAVQRIAHVSVQIDQARQDRAKIAEDVEQCCLDAGVGTAPFLLQLQEQLHRRREQQQALQIEQARLHDEQARLDSNLAEFRTALNQLEPSRTALRQGRWWTLSYWKARRLPDVLARCTQLEAQIQSHQNQRDALHEPLLQIEQELRALDDRWQQARRMLLAQETARRQADLDEAVRVLEQEQARLEESWREACRQIADADMRPLSPSEESLRSAHARWQARRHDDEEGCRFAASWCAFLESSIDHFLGRMPGFAPVVAGTARVLAHHPDFADAAEPWDLLMVLDADESSEPDLVKLIRKARRVVLLGGTLPPARNGLLSSSAFHRLWSHLVGDRSHLHYAWQREGDRWNCHLRWVADQERELLETENLADFPEIELRILALPGKRPVLAQVLFPRSMELAQAKAFIFSELQELALECTSCPVFWRETPDAWILHCCALEHEPGPVIEIDRGVHEYLRGASTQTAALHFSKSQGWTWSEAAAWVSRLLNVKDLGRAFAFAAKPTATR